MRYCVLFLLVLVLAACGADDAAGSDVDAGDNANNSIRPESDAGRPPVNTGNSDNGSTNNSNNTSTGNSTDADAGMAGDAGAMETCDGLNSCVLGETRCAAIQVQECEDDGDGDSCGTWGTPMGCGAGEICADDACQADENCADADMDGFGDGCLAGTDCDDSDPDVYPGNAEVCDGKDNDCKNGPDDAEGLGGTCTEGMGACAAMGTPTCEGTMLVCDAMPSMPSTETCDQIDNDCDGQIDEDSVCTNTCTDMYEPNNGPTATATLPINTRSDLKICGPNDEDWFTLPTTPGLNHLFRISFDGATSDLDIVVYEGTRVLDVSSGYGDVEEVAFNARPGRTYRAVVVNQGTNDNPYSLQYIDVISCSDEDGFYPNQSRADAAPIAESWIARAHACTGSTDYYSIGNLQTGDTITVHVHDRNFGIGDDLDLFLLADPDGDGTFTRVESSTSGGLEESLTHTATHDGAFYYEVVDVASFWRGSSYSTDWFFTP